MAIAKRILNVVQPESDSEAAARIAERFEVFDIIAEACILQNTKAMVVSGAPGLGKSHQIGEKLESLLGEDQYTCIKGYVRPTGLLKLLYQYRHPNSVIVFDDADSILADEVGLNLIKAICDTTSKRLVSWLSEGMLFCEATGERIPKTFEFNGSIIFITNLDMDAMVQKKHKMAPHLAALLSRAHYVDLTLKTRKDFMIRIMQVIPKMLAHMAPNERKDVENYLRNNFESLRELSLRSALKIASLRTSSDKWKRICDVTMLRS